MQDFVFCFLQKIAAVFFQNFSELTLFNICLSIIIPKLSSELYSASISLWFAPKKMYVQTGKMILPHSVQAKIISNHHNHRLYDQMICHYPYSLHALQVYWWYKLTLFASKISVCYITTPLPHTAYQMFGTAVWSDTVDIMLPVYQLAAF